MSVKEVEYGKYAKLFSKVLDFEGFPKNIIDIYDWWITDRLPKKIESKRFELSNNKIGTYRNVHVRPEAPKTISGRIKIPADILDNTGDSYMAEIVADIVEIDKDTGVEKIIRRGCILTKIPNMLGSSVCYLKGKTPEELIAMRECPCDSFAYFRVSGAEKIIVIQENLRLSEIFVFQGKKGKIDCRTTVPCENGTTVTMLHINDSTRTLELQLGYVFKLCLIPVFGVFLVLGWKSDEAMANILKFIRPEHHEEARMTLISSIQQLDSIVKKNSRIPAEESVFSYISEKLNSDAKIITPSDKIKRNIQLNLFPNIVEVYGDDDRYKLLHLAMMTARLVQYLMGVKELDDRDSWGNKRLETAGRQLEKLFNIMFDANFNEKKTSGSGKALVDFANQNNIAEDLQAAMVPNGWGARGQSRNKKKENIVDYLKRDTALAVKQQTTKINVQSSKLVKDPHVRAVKPSQYGYVDPAESPEGEVIGLVNNMTASNHISLERNPEHVMIQIRDEENFSNEFSIQTPYPLLIDGIIRGWIADKSFTNNLVRLRRRGVIEKDVCIYWNHQSRQLEVYCNSSRPTRPVLVVDEETQLPVIEILADEIGEEVWSWEVSRLIKSGSIEYLDAKEQENYILAENPRHLKYINRKKARIPEKLRKLNRAPKTEATTMKIAYLNWQLTDFPKYTHCSIDSMDMFSLMSSLAPKGNQEQGPRVSYQAGMVRQSLSSYHSMHHQRFDTGYKVLLYPSKPIFEVQMAEVAKLGEMPAGVNMTVAFLADPANQEDGIKISKDAVHKFKLTKYSTIKIIVNTRKTSGSHEELKIPEHNPPDAHRYGALAPNGLPIPGKYVKDRDYILGRVREDDYGDYKNASYPITSMDEGYIDRVSIESTGVQEIVKIKIRKNRSYIEGDKAAARYSQKGVLSKITRPEQLPFVLGGPNHGISPDIIVNSHSIPSRMTMGFLIELLSSKAGLYEGCRINGTTFSPLFDHDSEPDTKVQKLYMEDCRLLARILEEHGMFGNGKELMGYRDGRVIQTLVNFGVVYYAALRHHVLDKIQVRNKGTVQIQTHQPVAGRAKIGGLRFGEMEQNAQVSLGNSATIQECLFYGSDAYKDMAFCGNCGILPTYRHSEGGGPPAYACKVCRGSNFVAIDLPYTFKYLMQNLAGIGIEVAFDLRSIGEEERLLI